jgi:thiol-disulfide isomerase/thioredoxin
MALRRLLAGCVLVIATLSPARAEPPAMTTLLKSLDLVGYRTGTKPPQFSGDTLDARRLSLNDLGGKVVIVNFWASWCLECRPEMPALNRLQRDFALHGLAIVGINAREDKQTVLRYSRELGLTFPLVLDQDGSNNRLYGVVAIPTTFVIGRDGRAVAFCVGPRDWAGREARALLDALLAEPPRGVR